MNTKHQQQKSTSDTLRTSQPTDQNQLRSQAAALAFTREGVVSSPYQESAAITSTTAIVSLVLTAFTLFALYTGLQNNVTAVTSQQQSLRVQIQLCLLLPLVIVYFTKVALEDYLRTLFSFNLSSSRPKLASQDPSGKDKQPDQEQAQEEEEVKTAQKKKGGANLAKQANGAMATKATVGGNPSAWQKPQVLFRDFQKQCMGYLTNWNHRRQVPSTIHHNLSKPPMLDLETMNAEWKAKKVLNEDGKPI